MYPNYNFVSWSYAFALFACISHIIAAIFLAKDARAAKERKSTNKALLIRLKPQLYRAYSDYTVKSRSNVGSGYL